MTVSITLISFVQSNRPPVSREPPTFRSVLAGFEFVRTRRRLLGVILLDLFVVILGGATALLPIFAKDILAVGPIGLGLLRSAPAAGALITTVIMSRYPVERHIGRKMFAVVAIYGIATIAFGLSTWFPLSLFALACLGASDAVSVVIRFTLVQIETPDEKRGRVSAINYLFVGSSNTLGEFESGTVAAWLGAVPSVLIGGIGSLLVAATWMGLFPDLRRIDRFEPADVEKAAHKRANTWEASMHILITGAAGMIGRKLTARLVIDRALGDQPIDKLTLIDIVAPARLGRLFRSRENPRRRSRRARRRGKSHRGAAGRDLPSRRRGVGRGGNRFRQGLSRQSRRHPRAAGSDPRHAAATSRKSSSPRRSRCSARRFPTPSPTTSISRR